MCEAEGMSLPPPGWMRLVKPGRLDMRVLGQGTYWVTKEGAVLPLDQMSAGHLIAVAEMLRRQATRLHFWAMAELIREIRASAQSGAPCGAVIEFALTGASMADVDPRVWIESLPLMRAIAHRLTGSG
jgi:hypothetical protein